MAANAAAPFIGGAIRRQPGTPGAAPNKSLLAYMVQKFPELQLDELREVLEKISRARGKPLSISVAPHPQLPSCFVLRREERAAAVA